MICLDTEDDSKGNLKIVNFFDGNSHTTFRGSNCRYRSWGFLHQIQPEQCWAVNAEYDLINLFGPWLGKLVTLQYVRSGLMRGAYREAKITFFDTLRHWAASVEDMGKAINLPKLSMPHLGCDCDDCVEYCRRDTEICWRFVDAMLQRYESLGLFTIRSTLPSMAFQLFRQFYINEFPEIPDYIKSFMRKGYYGGRVEVYQLGIINGTINHYDINSLFPSVMSDNFFPSLSSWYVTTKPNFQSEGIFEGWINIPFTNYPCLPVRDDEILFPYGSIYGTWPYPEIRQLLKDGGRIIRCKEVVEFSETEEPFKEYVDYCYKKRLQSDNDLDKTFWKLMLNSLYGKFGQSSGLEIIYNDEDKTIPTVSKHANVIWSAYVTSYARLRLLSYLRSCTKVFYTDTDSLFTPDVLPTGSNLGSLKKEGIYKSAQFKGNKLYCVENNIRAKGVPRKVAGDFFRTGKAIFKRPARFKESRRTNKIANVWYDMEKEAKKEYTKRKILNDNSTEPWNYNNYIKFKKSL